MRWLLPLIATSLLMGCGGTTTKTVTETRTVEIEVPAEDAPAEDVAPAADTDFCGSDAGDALAQADSEAGDAFNDVDPAAFKRAYANAMRAAKKAPDGTDCVAQALNSIVFNLNHGSGNLDGLDLKAMVRRIRRFEEAHDLPRSSE